tara:strand:+ start:293675 stop:294760 length:1086 start_codon:yes stop_codon:yes gene_type:complete
LKLKLNFPFDTSPKTIAWFNATMVFALYVALTILIAFLNKYVELWILILLSIPVYIFIAFRLAYYCLDALVYPKVKLIYKTIHNLKGPAKNIDYVTNSYNSRDFLKKINQDVVSWSIRNKEEIESLKERENFRRDYVGNLAHELRTPLFLVQGYVQTLFEGGIDDELKSKYFLEKAAKGVDRMVNLIEDLEAITKLEAGNIKIELKPFNITALASKVFDALDDKASEKNIELVFSRNYAKGIWVNGDQNRIEQVFTNLIVNAINYSKPEGGTIEVRFFDLQESIVIEVSDNGIGIDKEDLPRIFERFYRVEKSRNRKIAGSGLGLSICKHILEAHGKVMNVRSVKNTGTTFSFSLDRASHK